MAIDKNSDFIRVHRYVELRNRQYGVSEPFAKKHGFTISELLVLIPLYFDNEGNFAEGCTQSSIVAREGLTKQLVSTIIHSFYKKGWVTFSTCEADKRAKIIRLTDEGRANTEKVVNEYVSRWNRAIGSLTSEEYESFISMMELVADKIGASFAETS